MTAEDLAFTILTIIAERHVSISGGGYYGVMVRDTSRAEILEEARSQLLDGTDDFVAICEEALRRLKP